MESGHETASPSWEQKLYDVYQQEMKIRNYSPRTIKTYTSLLKRFVKEFLPTHPRDITPIQIKKYLFELLDKDYQSCATIDQTINALRILYKDLYKMPFILEEIPRPRSERAFRLFYQEMKYLKSSKL